MQFNKNFTPIVKGVIVSIVVLGSLFSIGCDRQKQSHQQSQAPPPAPEVAAITVSTRQLVLTTELPGRTVANREAQIRPQVNGLIQKRLFEEGSSVAAGQVLYQIDPASFQAGIDSAKANLVATKKTYSRAKAALAMSNAGVTRQEATLALAQMNCKRFKELAKVNAVSASEYDQSLTELKVAVASLRSAQAQVESDTEAVAVAKAVISQAEAALKTAQINLGYCRILAPIDGRIGKSSVTEGAIVTAYQPVPLSTILQLDPIYVDVPQTTAELLRLKRRVEHGHLSSDGTNQNKVKLLLEDGSDYPFEGDLQFQDVTVDPTTGSVILRVLFPNPDGLLLPGMFVQTIIKEGIKDDAILITQQGVSRSSKGDPMALVVNKDSKVELRMLTIDRAVGNQWLISDGLKPGDRVIVEGMQKVRPGSLVRVVPFKERTSEPASKTAAADPSQKRTNGGD